MVLVCIIAEIKISSVIAYLVGLLVSIVR
jgi:hypothetical protein